VAADDQPVLEQRGEREQRQPPAKDQRVPAHSAAMVVGVGGCGNVVPASAPSNMVLLSPSPCCSEKQRGSSPAPVTTNARKCLACSGARGMNVRVQFGALSTRAIV